MTHKCLDAPVLKDIVVERYIDPSNPIAPIIDTSRRPRNFKVEFVRIENWLCKYGFNRPTTWVRINRLEQLLYAASLKIDDADNDPIILWFLQIELDALYDISENAL